MSLKNRSFLKLLDYTPAEIEELLDLAADLKAKKKAGIRHNDRRRQARLHGRQDGPRDQPAHPPRHLRCKKSGIAPNGTIPDFCLFSANDACKRSHIKGLQVSSRFVNAQKIAHISLIAA